MKLTRLVSVGMPAEDLYILYDFFAKKDLRPFSRDHNLQDRYFGLPEAVHPEDRPAEAIKTTPTQSPGGNSYL